MNTYLSLITVVVSGAFGLLVAVVTMWMTGHREIRNYARERARERFDAIKSLYASFLAQLEKGIRCTEQLGDYSELSNDLPLLNAQMLLIASKEVSEQSEACGDLLYQWSTEYRRGSPKQVGDLGVSIVQSGDSEHLQKARELRPKLMAELTKLVNVMKEHLRSIEP